MNRLAVQLNNRAVDAFQDGRLYDALESISLACHLAAQQSHVHTTIDPTQYRFHWRDCSRDAFKTPFDKIDSRSERFLYLSFLIITAPEDDENNSVGLNMRCPCGFAWAIWYNMSLLYVIAGVVSGEKGHVLLHCAGIFLAQVKKRIELAEKTPSRDWARLQIAVLNNQIFVSNELCLHDQAKEQVTEMTKRLCGASKVLDVTVWQEFALNLQCLNRTGTVALAA